LEQNFSLIKVNFGQFFMAKILREASWDSSGHPDLY